MVHIIIEFGSALYVGMAPNTGLITYTVVLYHGLLIVMLNFITCSLGACRVTVTFTASIFILRLILNNCLHLHFLVGIL